MLDSGFFTPHTHITFEDEPQQVDDEVLRELFPSIRRLRPYSLSFTRTSVSDDSMPLVRQLDTVIGLSVRHTPVTAEGLRNLRGMRKLKNIYVADEDFDDNEVARLERDLPGVDVRRIRVDGSPVGMSPYDPALR